MPEEKEKTAPFDGFHHEAATPVAEFVKRNNAETVTMTFPRQVTLLLDNHERLTFPAGPQEVPVEHKNHWYLEANGAVLYEPRVVTTASAEEPMEKPEDSAAEPGETADEETEEEVSDAASTRRARKSKKG